MLSLLAKATATMPLYPDLAVRGIEFMRFSLHVSGGLEKIDNFWEQHGLARTRERLLFAGYTRRGQPHTVWLQWARSHEGCCDVYFGLDCHAPSHLWPKHLPQGARLREADFRAFIIFLGTTDVAYGGVKARYGYLWNKNLDAVLRLAPHVRPRILSLDVLDEKNQLVMNVSYEKKGDDWLAIIAPAGRFEFIADPAKLFKTPYETAGLLATSLSQQQLDPL
jgi:hypothetical protein